jgi:hypothetical protein
MQRFNVALNVNHRAIVSCYRRTSVPSSQCYGAARGQLAINYVGWNETDGDGEAGLTKKWRGGHQPRRLGLAASGQVNFRFTIYNLRAAWKSGSGS